MDYLNVQHLTNTESDSLLFEAILKQDNLEVLQKVSQKTTTGTTFVYLGVEFTLKA